MLALVPGGRGSGLFGEPRFVARLLYAVGSVPSACSCRTVSAEKGGSVAVEYGYHKALTSRAAFRRWLIISSFLAAISSVRRSASLICRKVSSRLYSCTGQKSGIGEEWRRATGYTF